MVRSLFFILKVGCVGALFLALSFYSGDVVIHWQSYTVKTSTTVLGIVVISLMTFSYLFSSLLWRCRHFSFGFSRLFRFRTLSNMETFLRDVIEMHCAADKKLSLKALHRLIGLIESPVLRRYLIGKREVLKGNPEASSFFKELSTAREGKFLGNYELACQALKTQNYAEALFHAERAFEAHKESPWAFQILMTLYVREGEYGRAQKFLAQAERLRSVSKSDLNALKSGLFYKRALGERDLKTQQAYLEKALSFDPFHLPSGIALSKLFVSVNKNKLARRLVESLWPKTPHPELAETYLNTACDQENRLQLMDDLHRLNPSSWISIEYAAETYLKANLWGKARDLLKRIPESDLTPNACYIGAELEKAEYKDFQKAQEWIARMREKFPSSYWACKTCSAPSAKWSCLCPKCLSLNTIDWVQPSGFVTFVAERF